MVLLLYCIRLPRAASAGARVATTGLEWRVPGPPGGPRSATAWSPRSLRERVRPDVRLETPPRMSVGRATASGHRAVLKHEASCREDEWGRNGENNEDREGSHRHDMPWRHASDQCQVCAVSGDEIDVVPTVEANGNKPISPLSVAAEPHCVSVKNCSWGGGASIPPEDASCSRLSTAAAVSARSAARKDLLQGSQVAACGRLRGASIHRAK